MVKELVRKSQSTFSVFWILDIEQQFERYEMDNHLVENKYVAQHHSETQLEVENEEN